MSLTDNTYVAIKHLNHLPGSPYLPGDVVPGSDFTDDVQVRKYITNHLIETASGTSSGASTPVYNDPTDERTVGVGDISGSSSWWGEGAAVLFVEWTPDLSGVAAVGVPAPDVGVDGVEVYGFLSSDYPNLTDAWTPTSLNAAQLVYSDRYPPDLEGNGQIKVVAATSYTFAVVDWNGTLGATVDLAPLWQWLQPLGGLPSPLVAPLTPRDGDVDVYGDGRLPLPPSMVGLGASHAEGNSSHAEGSSSHAEGSYSHAEGESSHARWAGAHAAQGTDVSEGTRQYERVVLDSTGNNRLQTGPSFAREHTPLPAGYATRIRGMVISRNTAGTAVKAWDIDMVAATNSGARVVGAATKTVIAADTGASGYDLTLDYDADGISITPSGGPDITVATIEFVEVGA